MAAHSTDAAPDDAPAEAAPTVEGDSTVPLAVHVQILATEHWSLLASRTTTQAEVLTRITIFLTLVSAGLVSLALVGQVTNYSESFVFFAIAVLAVILVIGVLTQLRVFNVGLEDLMYVLAMNRLRGAYVRLDPAVAPLLMTSTHDDRAGAESTYYFLGRRRGASHFFGSSMALITLVNGALVGLLCSATTGVLPVSLEVVIVIAAAAGLAYTIVTLWVGKRRFERTWEDFRSRFPSPE